MMYNPDEFARKLVTIEEQGVSYSDEPDYCCNYVQILQRLQWKCPDGTTKPLVTIEVKDEVQGAENFPYRGYQDRPSAKGLEK